MKATRVHNKRKISLIKNEAYGVALEEMAAYRQKHALTTTPVPGCGSPDSARDPTTGKVEPMRYMYLHAHPDTNTNTKP